LGFEENLPNQNRLFFKTDRSNQKETDIRFRITESPRRPSCGGGGVAAFVEYKSEDALT